MDNGKIQRKSKRIDFSHEIKIRFAGQADYTSIAIKDISGFGLRAVVPGRLVKTGDPLEISMCINGREIQCKGKVVWCLMLIPSLAKINIFSVGVEFSEINAEDRDFLERLPVK
jgi:hypothetical protein